MAFQMVSHAFRMLFSNFTDALKLSLVPFLLIQAVAIGAQLAIFGSLDSMTDPFAAQDLTGADETDLAVMPQLSPGQSLLQLIVAIASLIFGAWLAVGWHRFVLAEEYPSGFVPPFRQQEVLLYVFKLIVLTVLMIIVSIPVGLVAAAIFSGLGAVLGPASFPILGILAIGLFLAAIWVFMRWSVVLPAASVGRNMSIGEAWGATDSLGFSLLWAGLLVGVFAILLQLLAALFFFSVPLLLVATAVAGLLGTLLGVSLATTIYGIAVEGRQLT